VTDGELEEIVRCAIQGMVDGAGIENLTARDLAKVAIQTVRENLGCGYRGTMGGVWDYCDRAEETGHAANALMEWSQGRRP
jgi:hypothetical protein